MDNRVIKQAIFPVYLAMFHMSFILIMSVFTNYNLTSDEKQISGLYPSKSLSNRIIHKIKKTFTFYNDYISISFLFYCILKNLIISVYGCA